MKFFIPLFGLVAVTLAGPRTRMDCPPPPPCNAPGIMCAVPSVGPLPAGTCPPPPHCQQPATGKYFIILHRAMAPQCIIGEKLYTPY